MTVSLISTTTRFNTTMAQYNTNYSRQSSTAAAVKPFCKVCQDAGKPESEYTSHFVKDEPGPKGKVVCPTLLSQACRICNETGHTSSYCTKYRAPRDNRESREVYYPRESERPRDRVDNRESREVYYPHESERARDRVDNRESREVYYPRESERARDRDISFNRLREDTERQEREIYDRDVKYYREKDRQTKPWLQAAMRPSTGRHSSSQSRRVQAAPPPYAHPHSPRVRLELESRALSAAAAVPAPATAPTAAIIDVRKIDLGHSTQWGDEDVDAEMQFQQFVNYVNADDNDSKEEERFREIIRADDDEDTLLTMSVSKGGNCFSSECD